MYVWMCVCIDIHMYVHQCNSKFRCFQAPSGLTTPSSAQVHQQGCDSLTVLGSDGWRIGTSLRMLHTEFSVEHGMNSTSLCHSLGQFGISISCRQIALCPVRGMVFRPRFLDRS